MSYFSLGAFEEPGTGNISVPKLTSALGEMGDPNTLEQALGAITEYGQMVAPEMLEEALGGISALTAAFRSPAIAHVSRPAYANATAMLARFHAIVRAGINHQVASVQRPNVYMVFTFDHLIAGPLSVINAKPAPPGLSTDTLDPMTYCHGLAFLLESSVPGATSSYGRAVLDIKVASIGFAQYDPLSPAGTAALRGMPLQFWAPQTTQYGLPPPYIRGLTTVNSNTQITLDSTATGPTRYAWVGCFRMSGLLSASCGGGIPSLIRGPMNLNRIRQLALNAGYLRGG